MLDNGTENSITNVEHDLDPESPECVVVNFTTNRGRELT